MATGDYDRFREQLPYIGINDYNNEVIESEFVDVPKDLKGHVIGRGGSVLQKIQQISGARVFSTSRDEEGFTVSGDEEQRSLAKMLILQKVLIFCGYGFGYVRLLLQYAELEELNAVLTTQESLAFEGTDMSEYLGKKSIKV